MSALQRLQPLIKGGQTSADILFAEAGGVKETNAYQEAGAFLYRGFRRLVRGRGVEGHGSLGLRGKFSDSVEGGTSYVTRVYADDRVAA